MADVITRFKLETTQYDSALRDASKALSNYSKQAELAGKDFDKFTQGSVESARALGNIAASATNTKDKVKELVSAYNDVAKAYNKLTDEQKQSDFGKAMAESLNQLQGRIRDAKAEMNSTGGILSQLKDKFTVNIDALKLFNVGLQAAEGALKVAKDAFFNNEEQLDTWGRVVESSQSLYQGFLNALNNGDISGYLNNISNITRAAQNAYDALDALSTFNAFNQVNVEKTRTGMTESIVDFREGTGSKDAVKAAGDAYKKELKERQKLEKEAYNAEIRKIAAQRGVSGNDLIMALSGSYGSYQSLKALPMSGSRIVNYGGGMFGGGGSYEEAIPANRQEKLGAVLRQLNDTELKSLQALGAQAERTGNEIASVDRQLSRVLNGRSGSVGGGGKGGSGGGTTVPTYAADSIAAQSALVSELTKKFNESGEAVRNGMLPQLVAAEAKLKLMKDEAALLKANAEGKLKGGNVDTTGLSRAGVTGIDMTIPTLANGISDKALESANKWRQAGDDSAAAWKKAASAVSLVGSAMSSIKDPALNIASTIGMAIANIAMAYSESLAKDKTNKSNIWYFIATAAAAMVSMATTISQIHSATGYAEGGFVRGNNSYSGDNVPIMANEGELVLTKAMQGNLASQMRDNGGFGGNFHAVLTGENIHIVHSRYLKRTGQGEIVTWR